MNEEINIENAPALCEVLGIPKGSFEKFLNDQADAWEKIRTYEDMVKSYQDEIDRYFELGSSSYVNEIEYAENKISELEYKIRILEEQYPMI